MTPQAVRPENPASNDGLYLSGNRAVVKVKSVRSADCVVGCFRYLANKRLVGSLLLGLYNEAGELDHVGFTSTIRNEDRAALTQRLESCASRRV